VTFFDKVKEKMSKGLEGEPLLSSVEFDSGPVGEDGGTPPTVKQRYVEISAAGVTLVDEDPPLPAR
jgi:hypothetical protein